MINGMTRCTVCRAPSSLFLCERHVALLQDLIVDLPWLLHELDTTRCRQDHLTVGSTRRSAETLNPLNIGASELARGAQRTLRWIVSLVGAVDAAAISRHRQAGDMYDAIVDLCGDPDYPDSRPGKILLCVNRAERVFAGPCPTLVGRDTTGAPIECAEALYAIAGQRLVSCPRCQYEIDVEKNRSRGLVDRDLMTETRLLAVLDKNGEHLPRVTFLRMVSEGRIEVRGYLHSGLVVAKKLRYHDTKVFSLSQVRAVLIPIAK